MAFDWDRWIKRLWFVNGVFVLPLVVAGFILMVVGLVSEADWFDRSDPVVPAADTTNTAASTAPRAVRYGSPVSVRGTGTLLVRVRFGEAYARPGPGFSGGYALYSERDGDGPEVNVMFLDGRDGPGRLLLDRPAYIREIDYPEPGNRSDSLQTWISYQIAFHDTDRNGRLDEQDALELYVSDLGGHNLRRVLPAGWQAVHHAPLTSGRLLILALEPPPARPVPQDERRQRAFVYELRTGTLTPHRALDSLGERAGQIVGRP